MKKQSIPESYCNWLRRTEAYKNPSSVFKTTLVRVAGIEMPVTDWMLEKLDKENITYEVINQ